MRDELLKADKEERPTIIEVASEQGFWHMGQFAADYRKLYGELPSESLISARATGVPQIAVADWSHRANCA